MSDRERERLLASNVDPAISCEIVHFFESLTGGGIYGNFSAVGHVGT